MLDIYDIPKETLEEYLEKLEDYKEIIDRIPDHSLIFQLRLALLDEHYELAQYIKEVAEKRGVKLFE